MLLTAPSLLPTLQPLGESLCILFAKRFSSDRVTHARESLEIILLENQRLKLENHGAYLSLHGVPFIVVYTMHNNIPILVAMQG